MYSGYRKYSDPLNLFTISYGEASCPNEDLGGLEWANSVQSVRDLWGLGYLSDQGFLHHLFTWGLFDQNFLLFETDGLLNTKWSIYFV